MTHFYWRLSNYIICIAKPKFQIFSVKSLWWSKLFRHLRKASLLAKLSKSLIKSEAAIQMCTIKKLFYKKMSQEKSLYGRLFSNKAVGYCTRVFLYVLANIWSIFLAKHIRVTPPGKYHFVCHVNLSHKCYHWPCFFRFILNIFRVNTSLF